jgi:hypothetical protein
VKDGRKEKNEERKGIGLRKKIRNEERRKGWRRNKWMLSRNSS